MAGGQFHGMTMVFDVTALVGGKFFHYLKDFLLNVARCACVIVICCLLLVYCRNVFENFYFFFAYAKFDFFSIVSNS